MIFNTYNSWLTTLWSNIKTDQLQDMNKSFFNAVKNITYKEIKNYKNYEKLFEMVINMQKVLPLLDALNCEDMKDRHWNELANVTGHPINYKSSAFCMNDLIQLELHNYTEKVNEIVDVAKNQQVNSKKIVIIAKNWEGNSKNVQKFEYEWAGDRESNVLTCIDKVIEVLEGDQMEIINMSAQGKYIEHMQEECDKWSHNLKTVSIIIE